MERPIGGNSFDDRPGTRMRIVMPPSGEHKRGVAWSAFSWLFKLAYALAAGALCVTVASYAPVAGPAIAPYVPVNCSLLAHVPSGAALHRALMECPALTELLNDSDMAALAESFDKKPAATGDEEDVPPRSLREQFDALYAKLPWPAAWLFPPVSTGFYPLIGDECAVALVPAGSPAYWSSRNGGKQPRMTSQGVLIFTRVSGSRGHLARMGAAFFHSARNLEIFDLGGGLMAVGLNDAYPEFEKHALPMVASRNPRHVRDAACERIVLSEIGVR